MKRLLMLIVAMVLLFSVGCFKPQCIHDWEKVSEVTLPSAYEQMGTANELKLKGGTMASLFQKKFILVLKCKKCGEIHKIVEENP